MTEQNRRHVSTWLHLQVHSQALPHRAVNGSPSLAKLKEAKEAEPDKKVRLKCGCSAVLSRLTRAQYWSSKDLPKDPNKTTTNFMQINQTAGRLTYNPLYGMQQLPPREAAAGAAAMGDDGDDDDDYGEEGYF